MYTELIGFTLETIGKLLIAYTAIIVHHRFRQEHCVDEALFSTMKKEQSLGILGIVLIVVGYTIQFPFKLN